MIRRLIVALSMLSTALFYGGATTEPAPTGFTQHVNPEIALAHEGISTRHTRLAERQRKDREAIAKIEANNKAIFEIERMKAERAELRKRRLALEKKIATTQAQRDALGDTPNTVAGGDDRARILFCIADHESHGKGAQYRAVSPTGKYRGAYQMDADFWSTYGDGSAATADQASPAAQDEAAWKGYLARKDKSWPWPPSKGKC